MSQFLHLKPGGNHEALDQPILMKHVIPNSSVPMDLCSTLVTLHQTHSIKDSTTMYKTCTHPSALLHTNHFCLPMYFHIGHPITARARFARSRHRNIAGSDGCECRGGRFEARCRLRRGGEKGGRSVLEQPRLESPHWIFLFQ